jgi:hypothetical protein
VTFVFPDGLAPEVYPLAWLVGRWEGTGVLEYPGIERSDIRARVDFDHDGGPYLTYAAVITLMGADGEEGQVWSRESGFWRISPDLPEGLELAEGQEPVELVVTDAAGLVALFLGAVGNGRIDLATDLMARTASAPDIGGATRLYGNVGGELLWAWDIAAFGHELQSYASGRLSRVADEE